MPKPQRPPAPKPAPAIGHACASGMVTVEIGPFKTKYLVHKALLVQHSEYFSKALSGPWKEAEERIVSLGDVGANEFNLFVHWLYTQRIPITYFAFQHVVKDFASSQASVDQALVLVKAYALGDRILAHVFRREINNFFVSRGRVFRIWPDYILAVVTYAFSELPGDRVILQFLTNKFCEHWDPETNCNVDEDALAKFPPTFTIRVMERYAYLRHGKYEGCYIEHATVQEKEPCGKAHMEFVGRTNGYGFFGEPRSEVKSN